jgi:hypothetical protein
METERLADLIEQKRDVLARLWQLAQRQTALVEESDLTRLLGLLAAKQVLLTQLQEVERQLNPYRDQDPEARVWRSPQVRERARRAAAECESMLGEIVRSELDCESKLVLRRDAAAHRLRADQDASSARAAYLQPAPHGQHLLDVSSET